MESACVVLSMFLSELIEKKHVRVDHLLLLAITCSLCVLTQAWWNYMCWCGAGALCCVACAVTTLAYVGQGFWRVAVATLFVAMQVAHFVHNSHYLPMMA